jgi:hypothetical protein
VEWLSALNAAKRVSSSTDLALEPNQHFHGIRDAFKVNPVVVHEDKGETIRGCTVVLDERVCGLSVAADHGLFRGSARLYMRTDHTRAAWESGGASLLRNTVSMRASVPFNENLHRNERFSNSWPQWL